MVRLYRVLVILSAIALLMAIGAVALLYNHQAVRNLAEITTKHNIGTDRILLNSIWSRYEDFLTAAANMDAPTIRARPETQEIHKMVAALTMGANVLKVKIYSKDGVTIFSTDPAEIGEGYSNTSAFSVSAREGMPSSALTFRDQVSAFSYEAFHRDVVETYVPIWNARQEVVGVFEVYMDVSDVSSSIDRTSIMVLVGLLFVFSALYGVLAYGILRRAIAPIRLAASYAAEIGPRSAGMRLPTNGMPREIMPLIIAANGAFERLNRALDAQRRFSVDAAHDLQSPLAVLKANLGALEPTASVQSLCDDVDAMSAVVMQLLELAETDASDGAPGDAAELCATSREVVASLGPTAGTENKPLILKSCDRPINVRCRQPLLQRALRTLVENALARTPPGSTVEVEIGEDGSVTVSDKGPGIPLGQRLDIFRDLGHDRATVGSGAGPGLSIVRRIAEANGGSVAVGDAPGAGTQFILRLPLA